MSRRLNVSYCDARLEGGASHPLFSNRFALFLVAHIPLALLMQNVDGWATGHAFITAGIAIWTVITDQRGERVGYAAAYIAGAEVLWRMTEAQIVWEFGKYLTVGLLLFRLLFHKRPARHFPLPVLYFIALTPSILLTAERVDFHTAIDYVSFNLSGPLALAVGSFYFSQLRVTRRQLNELMLHFMGPIASIATITIYSTVTATELVFTGESNFITSGGYGPNQVASVLGFGALCAFMYVMGGDVSRSVKILMFAAIVLFLNQSAMTFSRGGVYNAFGAALLGGLHFLRTRRLRYRLIAGGAIFVVLVYYVVLPNMDTFTGGKLSARIHDADLTGRDSLIYQDFEIWRDNPIMGVGPGMAKATRTFHQHTIAAHTEFSRLVAEHGTFGVLAILMLITIALENVNHSNKPIDKAFVSAMFVWSLLYMMNAAMRLVLPSIAFGIASMTVVDGARPIAAMPVGNRRRRSHVSSFWPSKKGLNAPPAIG
jgi:hypothetical protein